MLRSALETAGVERADAVVLAHVDPSVEDALVPLMSEYGTRVIRRRVAYGFGSSLALALAAARDGGEVSPGETVALATAGSGASWGAAVLQC